MEEKWVIEKDNAMQCNRYEWEGVREPQLGLRNNDILELFDRY